ncbi:hypothetical protein Ocin01_12426 [Orchesella cincta]|uniref:Uncharacterized protein n=1 Tax=Orchesella cincta TaxID=48709 RepID=A0A1D2MN26_ORCCI|nr:hypothetical protein Ocin01_12426 [Orchesella cincta]
MCLFKSVNLSVSYCLSVEEAKSEGNCLAAGLLVEGAAEKPEKKLSIPAPKGDRQALEVGISKPESSFMLRLSQIETMASNKPVSLESSKDSSPVKTKALLSDEEDVIRRDPVSPMASQRTLNDPRLSSDFPEDNQNMSPADALQTSEPRRNLKDMPKPVSKFLISLPLLLVATSCFVQAKYYVGVFYILLVACIFFIVEVPRAN